MSGAWVVMKRELRAFFVSPMAYIVLTAWLVWSGVFFWFLTRIYAVHSVESGLDTPITEFFRGHGLLFIPILVFVPVLTMRLIAAERQQGTLEPLLTAPVGESSVVVGKFGASMVMWIAMWLPTLVYAWILHQHGATDWGALAASYLGVFGMGLYLMAIGLLMSALAPNQIIAAVLAFLALGLLFALGAGEFALDGWAKQACAYISMSGHMQRFSKGIVDTRALFFDFSLALYALLMTIGVLKARRYA